MNEAKTMSRNELNEAIAKLQGYGDQVTVVRRRLRGMSSLVLKDSVLSVESARDDSTSNDWERNVFTSGPGDFTDYVFGDDGKVLRVYPRPNYTGDIAAAMPLIDELNADDWLVVIKKMPPNLPFFIDDSHDSAKILKRVAVTATHLGYRNPERERTPDLSSKSIFHHPLYVSDEMAAAIAQLFYDCKTGIRVELSE